MLWLLLVAWIAFGQVAYQLLRWKAGPLQTRWMAFHARCLFSIAGPIALVSAAWIIWFDDWMNLPPGRWL